MNAATIADCWRSFYFSNPRATLVSWTKYLRPSLGSLMVSSKPWPGFPFLLNALNRVTVRLTDAFERPVSAPISLYVMEPSFITESTISTSIILRSPGVASKETRVLQRRLKSMAEAEIA